MKNHRVTKSAQSNVDGRIRFDADRYSIIIAQGQIDLLFDVPKDQLDKVVGLVREHSRRNLVRHIAKCIAAELITSQAKGIQNDRKGF